MLTQVDAIHLILSDYDVHIIFFVLSHWYCPEGDEGNEVDEDGEDDEDGSI